MTCEPLSTDKVRGVGRVARGGQGTSEGGAVWTGGASGTGGRGPGVSVLRRVSGLQDDRPHWQRPLLESQVLQSPGCLMRSFPQYPPSPSDPRGTV